MPALLLINSPIFRLHKDPDAGSSVPPIGLGYIYTQLEAAGISCNLIDAVVNNLLPDELVKIIDSEDCDFVGLNLFSSNINIVEKIVRSVTSKKTFLLGGPAIIHLLPEIKLWKTHNELIVVIGDAELIIPRIVQKSIDLQNVTDNVRVVQITPDSEFYPQNIDLPLNHSIFINEPIYREDLGVIESHIITSRGCLYNCAFCTAASSCNQNVKPRFRSYESLNKEILSIKNSQEKVNCIRVLDDLFLRDQTSIELAIKLFTESNLSWRSMAHINTFKELSPIWLESIKHAGCKELFIGVESGCNKTLRHIRKPFLADDAYKSIIKILDSKISLKCYFILGLPSETASDVKETYNFASKISDYSKKVGTKLRVSVFRFRPYHGTYLFNEIQNKGQGVKKITNRLDSMKSDSINPFDCDSGIYAEYNEDILNFYMSEMEKLNE